MFNLLQRPLEGLDFLDRTMLLFLCNLERMCCTITSFGTKFTFSVSCMLLIHAASRFNDS